MPRVKLFDKEKTLHKAMELFWKKGYYDTSIQNMVSYLGINRGSMYTTFESKKVLFNKSLSLYCAINEEATRKFLQDETDVREGLKKIFVAFIQDAINDTEGRGCFAVNTTTEIGSNDEEVFKLLLQHKQNTEDIFYQYLLKGQKSGQIPSNKDLKSISFLIYTLFNGIRVVSNLEKDDKNLMTSLDSILSLLS